MNRVYTYATKFYKLKFLDKSQIHENRKKYASWEFRTAWHHII